MEQGRIQKDLKDIFGFVFHETLSGIQIHMDFYSHSFQLY